MGGEAQAEEVGEAIRIKAKEDSLMTTLRTGLHRVRVTSPKASTHLAQVVSVGTNGTRSKALFPPTS
jgi:hypothetical protein